MREAGVSPPGPRRDGPEPIGTDDLRSLRSSERALSSGPDLGARYRMRRSNGPEKRSGLSARPGTPGGHVPPLGGRSVTKSSPIVRQPAAAEPKRHAVG